MIRTALVVFSAFLIFGHTAHAQKITLEAGYLNPKRVGSATSETYFDAIRIGALAEYELPYQFGFQTGILLNTGYSHKIQRYSLGADTVLYTTWSHALEIPGRLIYHQKLFRAVSIFGFAGPNLQIGLLQPQNVQSNLNENFTNITGIVTEKRDLYSADILNRVNVQLGAGGGVQWRNYLVKGGFDWGLNNLDRTKNDYIVQRNWYVSFGYQLK